MNAQLRERLQGLADALIRRGYPDNAELIREAIAALAAPKAGNATVDKICRMLSVGDFPHLADELAQAVEAIRLTANPPGDRSDAPRQEGEERDTAITDAFDAREDAASPPTEEGVPPAAAVNAARYEALRKEADRNFVDMECGSYEDARDLDDAADRLIANVSKESQ